MKKAIFLCALAAFAGSANAREDDSLTIAVGAATVPRFEGSDKSSIIPAGAIRGTVSGVSFNTVGTALFIDVIPSKGPTGAKFVVGPMAHVTLERTDVKRTRDPQIIALGKLNTAVEVGAHFGLVRTGVITSDYDRFSVDVAVSHGIIGAHDSLIVTPSVSYGTPLSKSLFVGASVSADYVGGGYARTYFSVTPTQSAASGIAPYTIGSGIKSVNIGTLGGLSLSGDLRRGLSAFAIGNYARLQGAFGRSPIVRDRNQWFGGLGLAYTF